MKYRQYLNKDGTTKISFDLISIKYISFLKEKGDFHKLLEKVELFIDDNEDLSLERLKFFYSNHIRIPNPISKSKFRKILMVLEYSGKYHRTVLEIPDQHIIEAWNNAEGWERNSWMLEFDEFNASRMPDKFVKKTTKSKFNKLDWIIQDEIIAFHSESNPLGLKKEKINKPIYYSWFADR